MKNTIIKRNLIWFLVLTTLLALGACKKHYNLNPGNNNNGNGNTSSRLSNEDSLKFYVWWFNESDSANIPLYYWYDKVPATFNPFDPVFDNADSVLSGSHGIASYSVVDGKRADRFSFLDRTGVESAETEGGVSGDFGFQVIPVYEDQQDTKIGLYVMYVYPGSPAGEAGVQRGWEIASVNGESTLNLTTSSNLDGISKAIYSNPNASFTFQRPDGSKTSSIDLARTTYHINPVLLDTIYTINNEKIGYFVYNSFIDVESETNGAKATQEIDDAFSKFKLEGVKELIVDLRYNLGGAGTAAEYLDDLIAPASANGQEMYKTLYNNELTAYFNSNSDLKKEFLTPINFKIGSNNLNLSRVFFIVSNDTYSASELTINNLKPYMDVYLIGDTTGGKPFGFIPWPISFVTDTAGYAQVATMYAINMQVANKDGEGDYYWGMVPNYVYPYFDVSNWGDTAKDGRLHAALSYIETGSYERAGGLQRKVHPNEQLRIMPGHKMANPHQFKGLVYYNKYLKLPIKMK